MARKKPPSGWPPDEAPAGPPPAAAFEGPPVNEPELTPPVEAPAGPDPVPPPAEPALASPTPLEARIDRLENALAPLHQLEGLEERLFDRVTAYLDRGRPAELVAGPPEPVPAPAQTAILRHASALGQVGRHLMHSLVAPAAGATADPSVRASAPARPWALRELFAEVLASFYMFVDPRYHLSWVGRVAPAVLLALFLTTGWWVKYSLCGLGVLFEKPIELLLCYALVKLLSFEARRYRETAPDLPPSLRL